MRETAPPSSAPLLDEQPSRLLAQVAAQVGRVVSLRLETIGTHRYQFAVLATLDHAGACSQADLSRHTAIDRSDMVATLAALEAKRQVARQVDVSDKRRNVVSITEVGRAQLRAASEALAAAQAEAFSALSAHEFEALIALLHKLRDAERA